MTLAVLNRRIRLPQTTDIGWPTDQYLPYILGDFHESYWSGQPMYYGSGDPVISPIIADDAAGADWEVTYGSAKDYWNVKKDGNAQAVCRWGEPYSSDAAEVSFTVALGATTPRHGSAFRFKTYQGGRFYGYSINRSGTLQALAARDVYPTTVYLGTSKLTEGSDYDVFHGSKQGHSITWIQLTAAPTGGEVVSWAGYGSRWEGANTFYAQEHARQIICDWGRPDGSASWSAIINQSSYRALARDCAEYGYRTRVALTSPVLVREALERVLMHIGTFHTGGEFRVRFVPTYYRDINDSDVVVTIPEHAIAERPVWTGGGRAEIKNKVRVHYDQHNGAGTDYYIDAQDDRSIRRYGERQGDVEGRYKVTAECLYDRAAVENIADAFLRRHARPMEIVTITLDYLDYYQLQVGDRILYSQRDVPDRENRLEPGVVERQARVDGIEYDFANLTIRLTCSHIPLNPITLS